MGLKPEDPLGWPGVERILRELRQLKAGQICRPGERERCRAENGRFAEWACRSCREYVRPEAISPWSWHLWFLYRLKKAGYPFRADDLTLETWLLLGLVEEALTSRSGDKHDQREKF